MLLWMCCVVCKQKINLAELDVNHEIDRGRFQLMPTPVSGMTSTKHMFFFITIGEAGTAISLVPAIETLPLKAVDTIGNHSE